MVSYIRKLLEASLKEICHTLEVKLPFRFNDENERRMSGELLSELRATVNRKCPPLKGHASFANLEGSSLIITVGSHDNPAETITGGDIDVALADVAALTDHFTCQDRERYVEAKRQVPGQDKIGASAVRSRSTGSNNYRFVLVRSCSSGGLVRGRTPYMGN
jgi:hypothetical protein